MRNNNRGNNRRKIEIRTPFNVPGLDEAVTAIARGYDSSKKAVGRTLHDLNSINPFSHPQYWKESHQGMVAIIAGLATTIALGWGINAYGSSSDNASKVSVGTRYIEQAQQPNVRDAMIEFAERTNAELRAQRQNLEGRANSAPAQQTMQNVSSEKAAPVMKRPQEYSVSSKGLNFIMEAEGYSNKVYKDIAGHSTIGYGHKITKGERIKTIALSKAQDKFMKDIHEAERMVKFYLEDASLTQCQYDSAVSLYFREGAGNMDGTDFVRELRAGHYSAAAKGIDKLIYAKGKPSDGLKNRAAAEKEMFLGN